MTERSSTTLEKSAALQHRPVSSGLLQRKCACGNHTVAGGECSECAKKKSGLQRKLSIGTSNDPLEKEADRIADQVMSNRFTSTSSISSASVILQREDVSKEKTNEEKYKEGLEKLGEAFLKTPLGKELIEKLKQDALVKGATQLGKDFISTLPGKIITGAAATGAVATLAATHKELPAQISEIPLDFVVPGLSVNLTYKGPVDKPTEAMITFKFTEQKASSSYGKKPMSASEEYRAETARLAEEQAKFRANMRYKPGSPEYLKQRQEEEALRNAALKYRGGIDIDRIIKQSAGLTTPESKNGLQLTMPNSSFGRQSPSLFGDDFKLLLPEEQKKKNAPLIQKKLRIGASNDPLEQEADRVADQVLSGSTVSDISHSVPGINRYISQSPEHSEEVPPSVGQVLASSGRPLESNMKYVMESRFGYDFTNVRVHTGYIAEQSAQEVNANAYTVGNNLVFGAGRYAPNTNEGMRLLAHELTHVVQQSGSLENGFNIRNRRSSSDGSNLNPLLQRQSKPGQQPITTIQHDVPGENPQTYLQQGTVGLGFLHEEIRIDGDGDQYKELALRMMTKDFWSSSYPNVNGPAKAVILQIVQVSSGQAKQVEISLPNPMFGGDLFPIVKEVTDGRGPTRISLVTNTKNQWLEIYPPGRTATGVAYPVVAVDQHFSFQFPPEKSEIHKVATQAGSPQVVGGILFKEVELGAYKDRFGVSVRPLSQTKAEFGISQLSDGAPINTQGAELKINGQIRYQVVDTGSVSFGLDLDGDNSPDLLFFDRLTTPEDYDGGGPPEKNRNHRLRITGPAIGTEQFFDFKVRYGYPVGGSLNPTGINKTAESNALAVRSLSAQAKEGGIQSQIDAAEFALMKVRQKAADNGVIWKQTFEAWKTLSTVMIQLKPQTNKTVDAALQDEAAKAASRFYKSLKDETASSTSHSGGRGRLASYNPYTKESSLNEWTYGPGAVLEADIRSAKWDKAFSDYQQLVSGLDRWIVDQLQVKRGTGEAHEAERLGTVKQNLQDIERYKPTRVLAVFHPDQKFKTETGYIAELPLSLYYWKEGKTWHLKDLTNPSKTYEYTVDGIEGETEPPRRLLAELNDPDHFPVGVIHYEIPGRYADIVTTRDYLTWKKFFTYLSLGLAAVGLTLTTFGSGTVAVAGAWALGSSAVLGTLSAGIDLAEHIQQGNLDTTTAVLDLVQVVGGLAGAGAISSGAIVRSASNAPATARWAGAWAKTAMFANRVYLPVTKATAAADVVTFAVVLPDTVKQLENIQKGSGDQSDKDRAKLLLLSQLSVLGGLTALSAKGLIADTAKLPTLVLHPGPDGVPVVSTALTEKSIVLDTNSVAAFEVRARDQIGATKPGEFQDGHKARIKQLEGIPDADLRVADPTISTEKARKGVPVTQKGIGVTVDRASQEYQNFLKEISNVNDPVGGKKPNAPIDQAIFADTAFAAKEAGVIPQFATADRGIYNALSRRAGYDPKTGGKSVIEYFKDKGGFFDVEIIKGSGRVVRVIPLP